jgi:hypothetical protein
MIAWRAALALRTFAHLLQRLVKDMLERCFHLFVFLCGTSARDVAH